jgi:EAL domain-containing protein (putative c-di-GMP-specific phosphodiesterase class I)
MTESPEGTAVVRAILQLARSLNIEAVAEGVETLAQLEQLAAIGCCVAQGFLFSPAQPASEVFRLLSIWPRAGSPGRRAAGEGVGAAYGLIA